MSDDPLGFIPTLKSPHGYLWGVLKNMAECKRSHGDAFVRFGNTGKGIAPNYLITSNRSDIDGFPDGQPKSMIAYSGRSHPPFDWDDLQLQTVHWNFDVVEGRQILAAVKVWEAGKVA